MKNFTMPFRVLLTCFYICLICFTVAVSVSMLTYALLLKDARDNIIMGTYVARRNDVYIVRVKEDRMCLQETTDTLAESEKKIGHVVSVVWIDFMATTHCTKIEDYLQDVAAYYMPLIISVVVSLVLLTIALFFEYRHYKERKLMQTIEMLTRPVDDN